MVVAYLPPLRYSRSMSSPRCDSVSFSLYPAYPREMKPLRESKTAALAPRQRSRWVLVEGTLVQAPEKFFLQMPQNLRDSIQYTAGGGTTPRNPIRLPVHSSQDFTRLLDAFSAYNLHISAATKPISLERLLTLGSCAHVYQMQDIQAWFMSLFRRIVLAPGRSALLGTCTGELCARLLRIALAYRDAPTTRAVMLRWAARLHLGELPPLPALAFAETHGLIYLHAQACYVYLMTVARHIQRGEAFGDEGAGSLTRSQRTHVMAGYHSLRTCWRKLCAEPPVLTHGDGCASRACGDAWRMRWTRVAALPCALPEVDVIGRTLFVEKALARDPYLARHMPPECRVQALKAMVAKRDTISKQLHHHFDL